MAEIVDINDVIAARKLNAEEDDITKLTSHIKANGLKVPILVSRELVIIDGVRRFRAVQALGRDTIAIKRALLFEDAIAGLTAATKHGTQGRFSWQRIWEIYRDTRGLMSDRLAANRRMPVAERTTGYRTREMLTESLGVKNEALLQCVVNVYRVAESDTTERGIRANQAIKYMSTGEMSPYQAEAYTNAVPDLNGDITGATEQRGLLRSTTDTLSGVVLGFSRLGEINPSVTPEELQALLPSLRKSRREINRMVRLLEERAKRK